MRVRNLKEFWSGLFRICTICSFKLQVTVKFQTIPESASANFDYSVTSTDVILYNGETSKQLPIEVINDRTPELEETFRVRLLDQITGGAILGSPVEAQILIEPSDDPNGNFGRVLKSHNLS